ncbi:SDR family oxidoreductase [Altericroceibacterium endophyticum]|nr:SDR family oxidoreductase [Altericroceibacterium endophyticum]
MKVFIVGGAGKVARHLARILTARGHQPLSLYRRSEQADDLSALGAVPIYGDLTELSADDLSELMSGSDAVVFAAGAGGASYDLTNAIDGDGFRKSLHAAIRADVPRFLQISAFPEAGRNSEPQEGFENYMKVKKQTDSELAASDRDWVILRPGTLSDDPGTGKINAGLAIPYGDIPREDVALTLATILDMPRINRMILEVTSGDTAAEEAVARLSA